MLQGNTLTLTLPVSWSFRSSYNTTIAGSAIQGASEYVFTGRLVAQVSI